MLETAAKKRQVGKALVEISGGAVIPRGHESRYICGQ
jgi:hypothetical protein